MMWWSMIVRVCFALNVIGVSSAQWMRNAYHMEFHEICRIEDDFLSTEREYICFYISTSILLQ